MSTQATTSSGAAAATEENEEETEVYEAYTCQTVAIGKPHPGHMVEASNLSNVILPSATYPIEDSLYGNILDGTLSQMQLEGIVYACERHLRFMPNGQRCGFMLGDSAGAGKGRQIAAIILDSIARRRRKHVWFSVSKDLVEDATRDFRQLNARVKLIPAIAQLNGGGSGGKKKAAIKLNKTQLLLRKAFKPDSDSDDDGTPGYEVNGQVLFCTYSELISSGARGSKLTRYDELCEWLGPPANYDGVFVFDECHQAKTYTDAVDSKENATGDKMKRNNSSKTAEMVVEIQAKYPKARVVYASATGISGTENMGYMTRMGLWGNAGGAFKDYNEFLKSVKGMASLEALATVFKSTGSRVARSISYKDAEFVQMDVNLGLEDFRIYRKLAHVWWMAYRMMMRAAELCDNSKVSPCSDEMVHNEYWQGQYWSAHQRHMRQLITYLKCRATIQAAKDAIHDGMCVVIGINTTGEASYVDEGMGSGSGGSGGKSFARISTEEDKMYGNVVPEDDEVADIERSDQMFFDKQVSVCKRTLLSLIDNFFPVKFSYLMPNSAPGEKCIDRVHYIRAVHRVLFKKFKEVTTKDTRHVMSRILQFVPNLHQEEKEEKDEVDSSFGSDIESEAGGDDGLPSYTKDKEVCECLHMRERLRAYVKGITEFPPAVLDHLIHELGGPSKVAEMTGRSVRLVYDKSYQKWRKETRNSAVENLQEQRNFVSGKKLIAIISQAASTGISLHAERNTPNQRRRVHCTLELPWAADQAIQQLGRSHRTNQSTAPIFRLVSSGIGGEKRFISAVAKKLQALGALSHGDRRASSDLIGDINYDSWYGMMAVKTIYAHAPGSKMVIKNESVKDQMDSMYNDIDWKKIVYMSRFEEEIFRPAETAADVDDDADTVLADSTTSDPVAATLSKWVDEKTRNGWCECNPCISGENKEWDLTKVNEIILACVQVTGEERIDVRRFLNRIMGLPISYQTFMFNLFRELMEKYIVDAKRTGKFDRGIQSFIGQKVVRRAEPVMLFRDPGTGGELWHHSLTRDRGISVREAERELRYRKAVLTDSSVQRSDFPLLKPDEPLESTDGFYVSSTTMYGRFRVCLAIAINEREFKVIRPGTGIFYSQSRNQIDFLKQHHPIQTLEILEGMWNAELYWSLTNCFHGTQCYQFGTGKCNWARRMIQEEYLTGNVFGVWDKISRILNLSDACALEGPKINKRGQVKQTEKRVNVTAVQVNESDGRESRYVGIHVTKEQLETLVREIQTQKRDKEIHARQVMDAKTWYRPSRPMPVAGSVNYIRMKEEYLQWESTPVFSPGEQLAVWGVEWDMATGVVTKSKIPEILAGYRIYSPNPESHTTADKWKYAFRGQNHQQTSLMKFMRPVSEEERKRESAFWINGLPKEAVARVSKTVRGKLFPTYKFPNRSSLGGGKRIAAEEGEGEVKKAKLIDIQ